jgi:S-adenosyl methyltransferase
MSAQRPASPELDADDVADVRYPNTARIWNYQLGGKDNFPVDRKASDAANAMVRDISAPTGEDAAHDGRHVLQRMADYMLGQGVRQFLDLGSGPRPRRSTPATTSHTSPAPGWCSSRSRWRLASCARGSPRAPRSPNPFPRCPPSRFPARPPSRRRPRSESSRFRPTPRPRSRAARSRACEW